MLVPACIWLPTPWASLPRSFAIAFSQIAASGPLLSWRYSSAWPSSFMTEFAICAMLMRLLSDSTSAGVGESFLVSFVDDGCDNNCVACLFTLMLTFLFSQKSVSSSMSTGRLGCRFGHSIVLDGNECVSLV